MSLVQKHYSLETSLQDFQEKLVDECLAGSRKAQHHFYQQYARSMYNVSVRIVNDQEVAEDILQESFIDAFNRLAEFRRESTVGAWLKRIVVNNSINWLRKQRISWVAIEDHTEQLPEEDEPDWKDIELQVGQVKKAMEQLPEGYRIVLSLYLFEGYDHEEIAQVLNIQEATSRSQYLRGKRKLLKIISGEKNPRFRI